MDRDKFDKSGLRLINVTPPDDASRTPGELVVFATAESLQTLDRKLHAFRDETTRKGRPKNADLAQSIGAIQRAQLRSLWRGPAHLYPGPLGVHEWEVWLLSGQANLFAAAATAAGAHVAEDRLEFPEQTVIRLSASRAQMLKLVRFSTAITGLSRPAATGEVFDSLPVAEQPDWSQDLLNRTSFVPTADTYVTLMDTGVSLGHPLLANMIAAADRHVATPGWALNDSRGHGTGMAGLAVYGDLTTALQTASNFTVSHRLESVKVIPDAGLNPHHLLGAVTRNAVDAVEAHGDRRRVFTLAVTTPDDRPHDGAPTSWSAELDQLASGRSGLQANRRLFFVSAGNVPTQAHMGADYLAVCDDLDQELESPAQAWNAVAVGAMTDKTIVSGGLPGAPLATAGDLSPFSKTASWSSVWPLKPDIVLEGGNLLLDGHPPALTHPDLCLVTTHHEPVMRHFTTFDSTSAATALAARMAAHVWAAYPDRWPETIRALLVSSARWTKPMARHLPQNPGKGDYERLFRRYGYGVPSLDRALRSAEQAVTLIVQDEIVPYTHSTTRGAPAVHNEIRLHNLPWPVEGLRALRSRLVTLRVALSTFVEPNPAEASRGRKLQYGSHGLRFKLNRPNESRADFERRINAAAEVDDFEAFIGPAGGDDGWTFGPQRRDVGSLHIDEITCAASDLARRSLLAVHPVAGWWKSKLRHGQALKRARYALVVEIDAGDAEVDLYAEVQAAILARVPAEVLIG